MTIDENVVNLRARVMESLASQGVCLKPLPQKVNDERSKPILRELHRAAVSHSISRSRAGLERHEASLLERIASGSEIEPSKISPALIEVHPDTADELLFRYARLHWSIPVSAGYGRRLRFLLVDTWNSKLIGIVGLGDPVYSMRARDQWIGWNSEQKRRRIGSVMDAFVLGAVPPYSMILGGKLAALSLRSAEVSQAFRAKYGNRESVILGVRHSAGLGLVTTTSALGRSSLYNRLRLDNQTAFISVGYTLGSGEFQFATDLYPELFRLVQDHSLPTAKNQAWGSGFRSKREVVLKALTLLGLPRDLIYHGVQREMFVVPTAVNTQRFLQGLDQDLQSNDKSLEEISTFCIDRWIVPRSERDSSFRDFKASEYALWRR
ncbi:MAG: DUF4338 domain-containing protein [Thermomicrobiales bacterium]